MILDCQKMEIIMILRNFRLLIEFLIFGTACLMLYVDSVDLLKSRQNNFWMFQDVKYD